MEVIKVIRRSAEPVKLIRKNGTVKLIRASTIPAKLTLNRAPVTLVTNFVPPFRLPINNVTAITVPYSQHGRGRVSAVLVLNGQDQEVLVSKTIDQTTQAVSIDSNIPITGTLIIS